MGVESVLYILSRCTVCVFCWIGQHMEPVRRRCILVILQLRNVEVLLLLVLVGTNVHVYPVLVL